MAGESILANIVTEILKKLGSFALEEINLAKGVKKEVEKLKKSILMIQAVISDAENKQVKEEAVRIWLKELKDLAYEADDILDEYAYDLMHQRQGLVRKRDKVRNSISKFRRSSKMGHDIKDLNQKFDDLARRMDRLCLQTIGVVSLSHAMSVDGSHGLNRETYAFVDESKVLGREVDKSNIIKKLLANKSSYNENVDKISVIPIVGMGGLGKTTLAQLVYNDTVVQSYFNLKIWVCVLEVFEPKKIFLKITKSIEGAGANINAESDINFIVNQLQPHLRGKKFLLVLDDVWNKIPGEWETLKEPLMVGAEGSKILVTTRSENVASIVLAGEFSSYKLQSLGDDICLSIFEQRAFGPPSCKSIKPPTLVEIGKELVRKCGGLPLAAKALGSLMRFKKEVREWEVIRDSKIWESNHENPNEILPALKLSYDHLSPQVKQCFSYCSLFPKDSDIDRENLIRLWVAEGFIQRSKGDKKLLEEIGYEYFQILLGNSFFQGVYTNEDGEITSCKMHDLIHDLAQSVAGMHECSIMEASEIGDISEFRRLNLLNVNEDSSAATLVSKSKLRTLFIESEGIKDIATYDSLFNSHRKLRVLTLSDPDIEELPDSIGDLKHLRYLDLSGCWNLKKLPDSITRLYHLQTLILKGCRNLKKYPKDLNRLINLRHLECYQGTNDWQDQVGQLTCLQTLMNGFGVGGIEGSRVRGIGQLQCLNSLRGKLEITGLERVKGGGEENAILKAKKFIKQLNLRWGGDEEGDEEEKYSNHSLVLEGLQPHPNLTTLKIFDFMGPNFPTWMSNPSSSCLRNLVHLKLSNCDRCKQLPALGVLPSLRFLEIYRMLHLEEWLDQPQPSSSSSTPTSSYPLLESIKISECPNLKSMPTKIFSLKEFGMGVTSILRSNLLDTLATCIARDAYDGFKGFNLKEKDNVQKSSNGMGVSSIVRSNLNTLTKLVIKKVDGFEFLPLGLLKDNNVLQSLDIRGCHDFKGFNREGSEGDEDLLLLSSCNSLQRLDLYHCPVLRLLPGDLRGLTSLRNLSIIHCGESNDDHCKSIEMSDYCPMLKTMPTLFPSMETLELVSCDGKIVTSVLRSNLMDTLTQLWLTNIPGLMFLPLGLLKNNIVFRYLFVYDCPDFQGFIQKVEGNEDLSLSSSSNSSLWCLNLRNCPVLRLLPDLKDFTSLQEVTIQGCNEDLVISLPDGVKNRLRS